MWQQPLAGRGQHRAPPALEQAAADLVLEPRHAGRQRGLGDLAVLGGGGEARGLGHRQEVADEGQIHLIDNDNEIERNNRFHLFS